MNSEWSIVAGNIIMPVKTYFNLKIKESSFPYDTTCEHVIFYNISDHGEGTVGIGFIAKNSGGCILLDEDCTPVSEYYDEMTPLFCDDFNADMEKCTVDYLRQISPMMSKHVSTEIRDRVRLYNKMLCGSVTTFSPAIRVQKEDMCGVIDFFGKTVVPVSYHRIIPFAFESELDYHSIDHARGAVIKGNTSLYVCSVSEFGEKGHDVYDVAGNLIFENVSCFYPWDEALKNSAENSYTAYPDSCRRTVKSVCVKCYVRPPSEDGIARRLKEVSRKYTVKDLVSGKAMERCIEDRGPMCAVSESCGVSCIDPGSVESRWNGGESSTVAVISKMLRHIADAHKVSIDAVIGNLSYYYEQSLRETVYQGLKLSDNIAELDTSVRLQYCLMSAGIETVAQLLDYPIDELGHIKKLSKKTCEELYIVLERIHLTFGLL